MKAWGKYTWIPIRSKGFELIKLEPKNANQQHKNYCNTHDENIDSMNRMNFINNPIVISSQNTILNPSVTEHLQNRTGNSFTYPNS